MRALAFKQHGLGSVLDGHHMWVEFVVDSRLARKIFLGSQVFHPPQNPASSNSNSTRIEEPHENQLMWPPL